jgi:hypothetical protein
VGVAVHAVPDGDAGGAGCRGEGLGPDAGLGRDVFEAALPRLVLLAQPVRVDVAAGLRGGLLETGAGEELPDGAFAVPGDTGYLAWAESLLGERAELIGVRRFRFRRGGAGRELGCGVAGGGEPGMLGGGAEPGGDDVDGQAGADERVQAAGIDVARVRAGPGDAGDPVERAVPR